MNVTTVDTSRFFSSLDQYKVLKEKAAFALKTAIWEKIKWSDGDLDILRKMISLNATDETFQTEIQSKFLKLEMVKVNQVVCRLMGYQEVFSPTGSAVSRRLLSHAVSKMSLSDRSDEPSPGSFSPRPGSKSYDLEEMEKESASVEIQSPSFRANRSRVSEISSFSFSPRPDSSSSDLLSPTRFQRPLSTPFIADVDQKNLPPPRPRRPFPIPQIRSTFKDREIVLGSPSLPRAKSAFQLPEEIEGAAVKHHSSASHSEEESEGVSGKVDGGRVEVQSPLPVRPRRPLSIPQMALTDPASFKVLAEQTRVALQNQSPLALFQLKIAEQIVAADEAMKRSIPFSQAITVHLGAENLAKIIPDSALKPEQNPFLGRDQVLRETILSILEKQMDRYPSQRSSEPAIKYKADEKEPPRKKWPDFRKAKTMAHFPGIDDFYPSCLIIPELRMRLIEGAVCMKFLFVGSYENSFKTSLERMIVDRLFNLYFMVIYRNSPIKEALNVCFKELLIKKKGVVEAVLYKLSKDQTVSQVAKGVPAILTSLPSCFMESPFDDTAAAKRFLKILAHVKYRCDVVFGKLSSHEQKAADLVLNAFLMMDFLQFTFPKAIGFLLAQSPNFKEAAVGSLVRSVNLIEIIEDEPKKLSNLDYEEGLKGVYCLQHEVLFDYFVFYMGICIPRIEDHETRLVAQVIKAIDSRRKEEPFQKAWRNSFNPEGMQRILQGNDEENLTKLKCCLLNLSPGEYVSHLPNAHPALKGEEAFHDLLKRAEGLEITNEMEVDFRRSVSYLVHIKTVMEKEGLSWKQAIWLFLNQEALRELFDSNNDLENAKEFNSYLRVIE